MTGSPATSDLALVLSGGGARASYQVGVLAALAEHAPDLVVPIITGVSAGAINAAYLAAHPGTFPQAVGDLRRHWKAITPDDVYAISHTALAGGFARLAWSFWLKRLPAFQGVMDMRPLRGLLTRMIDFSQIDANIRERRLRAVALTATSYATGETVTFLHGDPGVTLWDRVQRTATHAHLSLEHVMASSAIPLVFPAVEIDQRFYGDGSVRQVAPLSPAIHLGASRLLVIGMRPSWRLRPPTVVLGYPTPAQVVALLFDSIFLDALDADAERLEVVNRLLADQSTPHAGGRHRRIQLLMLRPTRPLGELAAGLKPDLPALFERLMQGMGSSGRGAEDFLSYLLFDPAYTGPTMELGYEDTRAQWPRIEQFLREE